MSVRNSEMDMNGWTSFDVPNQFEDLEKQLATGSYYVQNVLDLADINTRLQSTFSPRSDSTPIRLPFRCLSYSRTQRTARDISILLQHCHVKTVRTLPLISLFSLSSQFDKVALTGRSQAVEVLLRCKYRSRVFSTISVL